MELQIFEKPYGTLLNSANWATGGPVPSQAGYYGSGNGEEEKKNKRTTPGIPTWSPTVVLTWPDSA